MKLLVISSAPFVTIGGRYHAYGPYIKEMEIWARHSDGISFLCPVLDQDDGTLLVPVNFEVARLYRVTGFNLKSGSGILRAIFSVPATFFKMFRAMSAADHIHLRCPGNISLIGCIAQIFFPKKVKTSKYAGNWDPNSKQPASYRIQKGILENIFLTRNIRVLVYGKWPNASPNIKPFFTASYREADKISSPGRPLSGCVKFIFAGTLSPGKRPDYAIEVVGALRLKGHDVSLSLYGDGTEREKLSTMIRDRNLSGFIFLMGNKPEEILRQAYQESHFVILPSKSEGWPKVVAEGMFWGCYPIATKVSCVPFMLGFGSRGYLMEMDLVKDVEALSKILQNTADYEKKITEGIEWSRQFTLDLFEMEIKQMLQ